MRSPRSRISRLAVMAAAASFAVAACGEDTIDGARPSTPDTTPAITPDATVGDTLLASEPGALPKPEVELPSELPTELVITDLTEGTGDAAELGDTVVVHYVGVRSEDGTEFDNSFDRGDPFPVTLGQGGVIPGWEQGLVGVKQGGRRQLDIPSDLAYGDEDNGDVIKAGDALTFVIDVVAVVGPSDPADAPDVSIAAAANQEQIGIEDLIVGDGPVLEPGQTAAIQIVAFRADTGEQLSSTWEDGGTPFTFIVGSGDVLAGIELGVEGMAVGGRRQVTVPFLMGFGDAGNEEFGLPASTDMVLVIDLVTSY